MNKKSLFCLKCHKKPLALKETQWWFKNFKENRKWVKTCACKVLFIYGHINTSAEMNIENIDEP